MVKTYITRAARLGSAAVLVLALAMVSFAPKVSALGGSFDWISRDYQGGPLNELGNGAGLLREGISADGRYALFTSNATDVVPNDTNGYRDLFMRDRQTGTNTLVSVGNNGQQGNNEVLSGDGAISGDGRYVVFSTLATNFSSQDFNNSYDVYLRDTQAGSTIRVCTSNFGGYGCNGPSISRDGRYVTYKLANPLNYGAMPQIFRYDRLNGQAQLVTINQQGAAGNSQTSSWSRMSTDGRYVVFGSQASNLVPNDTNNKFDIFRRDMDTGEIIRLSVSQSGIQANFDSQWPTISGDGRYVAFESVASNLVPTPDTNNNWDLFFSDITLGTIQKIGDRAQIGVVTANGQRVVFESMTNLVPNDTGVDQDVFSWERSTGVITRLSEHPNGSELGSNSAGNGGTSFDGRYTSMVGVYSFDPNDTNPAQDIYVYDRDFSDTQTPLVTGTPDRPADTVHNWYNNDVTITWNAVDPEPSSGAPTQPVSTTATQEGTHTYTSAPSCDPASNCSTGNLTLSIDKTAPSISYSLSQPPNFMGWHNDQVVVTFSCTDDTNANQSGIDTCTAPITIPSGNGTFTVTGTATDKAGHTTSINVTVNIDDTEPTITPSATPAPNAHSWNNSDVTVSFACSDNLSLVFTCSDPVTVTTEGYNQVITGTAIDNASNLQTTQVTLNIDKTAPNLGMTVWSNNPKPLTTAATLTVSAADALSGIQYAEYFLGDVDPGQGSGVAMTLTNQQTNAQGAVVSANLTASFGTTLQPGLYKINVRSQDKAGNWSLVSTDYLVVFDAAGPTDVAASKKVVPSVSGGDVLPGLVSDSQNDKVNLGFDVLYTTAGTIDPSSTLSLEYETGCNGNNPPNCHSTVFTVNTTSPNTVNWLTLTGQNSSVGTFQGHGTLTINGDTTLNPFRIQTLDGGRTTPTQNDDAVLYIYAPGTDPSIASPLYQLHVNTSGNWVKIN